MFNRLALFLTLFAVAIVWLAPVTRAAEIAPLKMSKSKATSQKKEDQSESDADDSDSCCKDLKWVSSPVSLEVRLVGLGGVGEPSYFCASVFLQTANRPPSA